MFTEERLATGNLVRLDSIADRVMRAGGLLATTPTVILINKKTPFLGMAALTWIVYGIYETFILLI